MSQIEAHDIGRRNLRLEPVVELDLLLDEFEVPECEIRLRFLHSRHHGDGPEEGKGQGRRGKVGRRRAESEGAGVSGMRPSVRLRKRPWRDPMPARDRLAVAGVIRACRFIPLER